MNKQDLATLQSEVTKAITKYKWTTAAEDYDEDTALWFVEFSNGHFQLRLDGNPEKITLKVYNGNSWEDAKTFAEQSNIETVAHYLSNSHDEINKDIFRFVSKVLMDLNALHSFSIEAELKKGRIPLFLERTEVEFLCNEWRRIPVDRLSDEQRNLWGNLAFKGQAALHKHGLQFTPHEPDDAEKYQ